MNKSKYICPICDVQLSLEDTISGGVAVWCAHANCPSHAASAGAEGKDEEHAHYLTQRLIEREVTQNDRHGPMCGCGSCMDRTLEEWNRTL